MALKTGRWISTAAVAIAGLALLWLSMANTVALVLGSRSPKLALALGLPSANAQAAIALSIATSRSPSPEQIARARALAQSALKREPVNVAATVALATLASLQNQKSLAERLFTYSERLSRHDSVTQLWMIERHADRGDVAGTLIHYDRLMTVKPRFRPTLIPILVQASSDPNVTRELATTLARRPIWWDEAIKPLIFQSPAPATTLPPVLQQLHLRVDNDQERFLLTSAITRLASVGALKEAYALYLQSGGTRLVGRDLIRNGGFEDASRLPPFDWDLHAEDGRTALIQPSQKGRGKSLFLYVDQDHQGEVARQLLLLGPGRYRLSARSGNIGADQFEQPRVLVSCVAQKSTSLADMRLPFSNETGLIKQADFVVPPGCAAQWMALISGTTPEAQDNGNPWIDELSVRRVG
jgi:hypothetical protein